MRALLRYAWAAPCSLLGLALAAVPLLCGASARRRRGVLEVSGPRRGGGGWRRVQRLPFAAITFGHVVLAGSPREMARWRAHERVHVRQYERWGLAFFVAYLVAGAWQGLRGRGMYWNNPFEVQARQEAQTATAGDSSKTATAGDCAPGAGSSRSSV